MSHPPVKVSESIGRPYAQTIETLHHRFTADASATHGGADQGPTPYDLLLSALGACTSITVRMYAARKQWPLENIAVTLAHSQDVETKAEHIQREITLTGPLNDEQRQRLLEIADKCPVHRTLAHGVAIESTLK